MATTAPAKKITEPDLPTTALVPLGAGYEVLNCDIQEVTEMIGEFLEDGLKPGDLEQIKIPTGGGIQWELPGGEMANAFEGVIVGIQTTRAYWEGDFAGGGTPPTCTSQNGKTGIGSPGGACDYCPKNQWGSGKNGVGTACAPRKRIYILRPEGFLPVVLALPVTSMNALRKYQIRLLSQRTGVNVAVTRFGLERTKNKAGIAYSQVTCSAVGPLPASLAPLARAYAKMIQGAVGIVHDEDQAPSAPAPFDPNQIPESDPPFGPFAKDARSETDEIPF
jgi:hypothetical protein